MLGLSVRGEAGGRPVQTGLVSREEACDGRIHAVSLDNACAPPTGSVCVCVRAHSES